MIARMPEELRSCLAMGAHTTLMVWADLDDNMDNGQQLRQAFWMSAEQNGITRDEFETVVFVFAKDRLENWIQFLLTGSTDEAQEGPREKDGRRVAEAAKSLAERCTQQLHGSQLPPSLNWSCENWRRLVERMRG